ncbi:MAG: hypothetical protein P4L71_13725 [Acetobacteraceae bacterium]|nr:hypothetical protein [Acetobacteraceae bacterium]
MAAWDAADCDAEIVWAAVDTGAWLCACCAAAAVDMPDTDAMLTVISPESIEAEGHCAQERKETLKIA